MAVLSWPCSKIITISLKTSISTYVPDQRSNVTNVRTSGKASLAWRSWNVDVDNHAFPWLLIIWSHSEHKQMERISKVPPSIFTSSLNWDCKVSYLLSSGLTLDISGAQNMKNLKAQCKINSEKWICCDDGVYLM